MTFAWLGDPNTTACEVQNVSYAHRVDDPESYNWCIVPDSGYDGVLFAGIALLAACCLQGKFSALWILLAGAACQAIAFPLNTGRWGNALALWLGITPADLFLYVFLPPILADAAVRISYFHFRKIFLHVISFAFLMVLASTFIMIPVLLYLFNLRQQGWYWQHAALFAAMAASTDAVAVGSILKSGGSAPEHLVLILEGESLFNDATSITLFEIMMDLVKDLGQTPASGKESLMQLAVIGWKILWLAVGGLLFGLLFGFLTRQVLKYVKRGGHRAPEQLALSLAMAYLAFYTSQVAGVSGVVAVVVFGLYGSANAKWNMSSAVTETPVFTSFWDTVSFMLNGIVFFYAGASSVNFFWRSSEELYKAGGSLHALLVTFWRLPLIYLAMLAVRGVCICLLNPIFRLAGSHMSAGEIVFSTIGGMRGAISLILAQMLVTQLTPDTAATDQQRVIAQIALWTAGVVVLTLMINAPLLPIFIKWTGMAEVSAVKARIRAKAARALLRYTKAAIHDLQHDEDEMLRGVDWKNVRKEVDMSEKLAHLLKDTEDSKPVKRVPRTGIWRLLHCLFCCLGVQNVEESKLLQPLLPEEQPRGSHQDPSESGGEEEAGGRAGRLRGLRERADAIWEEDAEEQGTMEEAQMPDTSFTGQQRTQGGTAIPGTVIGMVKGGLSNELARPSMVADLPFSRVMEEKSSPSKKKDAEKQSQTGHRAIDVRSGGSLRSGNLDSEKASPDIPRPPPVRTRLPNSDEETGLLSQQNLAAHDHPCTRAGSTQTELLSTSIYFDAGMEAASSVGPSESSTVFSEASEQLPWEPEVLSTDEASQRQALESPPRFKGVKKQDPRGNDYTVLPQPVLQPKMVRADDEESVVGQPTMRWMTVDLAELRRQQQRDATENARREGGSTNSRLTSAQSLHSRSSRTDARMLKRAMSGHLGRMIQQPEHNLHPDDGSELLMEARVRLVAGLKRYFHGKRAEGLLSARGVQLLDYACDLQMDHAEKPLFMWAVIEQEVCGHLKVKFLSRALFVLRKCGVVLRSWRPRLLVNFFLQSPNRSMSRVLASSLSSVMLLALEVAVEYWLALSWSPQAQWLAESEFSSALQDEAKKQSQQVWKFIINREMEAPARFQAIQTYRAAMAILRQQQHFVEQLYSSGMIDESERELILGPVQRQERLLQRRGPHWRAPSISEVLRKLPFMADLPDRFFDLVVSKGLLLKYEKDDVIWAPPERQDAEDSAEGGGAPCERSGIYIVTAGLISRSFRNVDGKTEELLMGSGGVFGLTSALVGESLPGSGPAVAIGNALAQGPVVFHWPQPVIDELDRRAQAGVPEWVQLRTDLFRVAALFVIERLKSEVVAAAVTHFQALALHRTRRRALRKLAKKYDPKKPKDKSGHVWLRYKQTEAAQKLVEKELDWALEAKGADVNEYEADSENEDHGSTAKLEEGVSLEPASRSQEVPLNGNLMTDQDIMGCMSAEKMWRKIRKRAAEALADLKEALRDADLVVLEPHQLIHHHSSIVLLKGNLNTSGRAGCLPPAASSGAQQNQGQGQHLHGTSGNGSGEATSSSELQPSCSTFGELQQSPEGAGAPGEWHVEQKGVGGQRWEVAVAYKGPCVLPWLWEDITWGGETLLKPQPIPFRAGPEGATLVVCPPEVRKDSSEGSPSSQARPENAADVISSLSRPSVGMGSLRPMQGILDTQLRSRRQRRLAEAAEAEATENNVEAPAEFGRMKGKQLRVLSIKPM